MRTSLTLSALALAALASTTATAADWASDTLGYKYYAAQSEPGTADKVGKNVLNFTHVSGDKLGSNLFSIDHLKSNNADPARGGSSGASEWYGFYKRTFSLSKQYSLAGRVDFGTKNTAFAPAPAKLHLGMEYNIPVSAGFWNVGVYAYKETNNNGIVGKSVNFDTALELGSAWSIPVAGMANFEGFLTMVGPKGNDGFGAATTTETLLEARLMFDVAGPKSGIKMGGGVQYWNNKFGCNNDKSAVANSCRATSPMVMATYKF